MKDSIDLNKRNAINQQATLDGDGRLMTKDESAAMKLLQKSLGLSQAQLNFDNGVPIFFMTI